MLRAGDAAAPGRDDALEALCRAYWYPVYAWIRGAGTPPEEAQDLTQGYFAMLLRRDAFATLDRAKGKFRTFIIRSLQNFLADEHAKRTAERRGGGRRPVELDGLEPEARYALEPATNDAPDVAFDRRWRHILVSRALARLESEQAAAGRAHVMDLLREFVGGTPEAGAYEPAASALGISTNGVAAAVRRLRARCREIIVDEILQTVGSQAEAEEELAALFRR